MRMGYEAMVDEVQDLYLDGKKDEAARGDPAELIEELALIGPEDKIRDDARRLARVDRHDAADRRRRGHGPHGRRDRAGLSVSAEFVERFAGWWSAPDPDRLHELLADEVRLIQPLAPDTFNLADEGRRSAACSSSCPTCAARSTTRR